MTGTAKLGVLDPSEVWHCFLPLTRVPRPSKNESAAIEHIRHWAQQHGFSCSQDEAGNLCVDVPASDDCVADRTVILQNHVDIVALTEATAKDADAKAGIIPIQRGGFDSQGAFTENLEGDWLYSPLTTMGADNGVGCAIAMALATDSNQSRPALQLLFTVDEEEGMTGAAGLDPMALGIKGDLMINIDTEDDDEITIGSAGGCTADLKWTGQRSESADSILLGLSVTGLKGGHSGVEIAAGRANAIRVLTRCLIAAADQIRVRLVSIQGGTRSNAIAPHCQAFVRAAAEDRDTFARIVAEMRKQLVSQFEGRENNLSIDLDASTVDDARQSFSPAATTQLLHLLASLPHGVLAMTPEIPDLVESSANLALVDTDENDSVNISLSCRSSLPEGLSDIATSIRSAAALADAEFKQTDRYPGWKPDLQSPLVQLVGSTYRRLFSEEPKINAIHAGLECGILSEKIPGVHCVSIGPTIKGNHAPGERVKISSVAKVHRWLSEILATLAKAEGTKG